MFPIVHTSDSLKMSITTQNLFPLDYPPQNGLLKVDLFQDDTKFTKKNYECYFKLTTKMYRF